MSVVNERAPVWGERGAWDVGRHRVAWAGADEFECSCRLARKKTERWRAPAHCRHVAAVRQAFPALDATARHFEDLKRALADEAGGTMPSAARLSHDVGQR